MNVVIVDGDLPYPPTSGKRLRTLNLMLPLARRHRLTYLSRANASSSEANKAVDFLQDHGIETILVDHPVPPKRGPMFFARLGVNLFSSWPYSVTSHESNMMRKALADLARRPVDLWQFEWSGYLPMFKQNRARTLVVAHNVDTLIWQRYHENESRPFHRWYIRQQWRKMEHFERWAFAQATRVVAVSSEDAALLQQMFAVKNVDVVDNGIDRASFETVKGSRDPRLILFLGALDWRPNLDAVKVLLETLFPAVRQEVPDARLCIVGRHPSPELSARIQAISGVELHADVADVRPYLAKAGVMAVPLRIGGGSRLKILEALACGLPVISTRIGAEGLCLSPGKDFDQVESIAEMTGPLIQALRNPERVQSMAEQARPAVLQRYDWNCLADKLERVWHECLRT